MTQDYFDQELFADFIIEAREHLETIEPSLLELEKNPGNVGLLNDIFRPMHSLKGASGFLGLAKINGLAHKAENILDELRTEKMVVTSEIMDLILSATDALTSIIDNLDTSGDEGDVETVHIIEGIEALLNGDCVPADVLEAAKAQKAEAAAAEFAAPEVVAPEAAVPEMAAAEAADEAFAEAADEALPKGEPYRLSVVGDAHLADFLEEAWEMLGFIGESLLQLEKSGQAGEDPINELFRSYHNLKGNCGIIGFAELGELTHEAETLLGKVRKGELQLTPTMVDLLLQAGDSMEECLKGVDVESCTVTPPFIANVVQLLQAACEGQEAAATEAAPDEAAPEETAPEEAVADASEPAPGTDDDDNVIFSQTVNQQMEHIDQALDKLAEDSGQREFVDALYRSLTTIQNSAKYMKYEDVATTAGRTAGLVDQARESGMDFGLMVDILRQECSILKDGLSSVATVVPPEPLPVQEAAQEAGQEAVQEPAQEAVAKAPVEKPMAQAPAEPKPEAVAEAKPQAPEKAPAKPKAAAPKKAAASKPEKAAPEAEEKKAKTNSTIRVDHEKLDHLMNVIGELIINRNRFAMLARSLEEGQMDTAEVAQSLSETTDAMARISDDLQDTIMKVRMVQVASVFSRFPRLVRDLSRKSGKQVELVTEGEDTELDKSLIEEIGDPLVHLVRNSLDHGLEPPEERKAAGKDPMGRVWLRAYHKGNNVAIEVRDDGRGIDPEKMRASAVKKGLKTEDEAAALSDREAIELIFAPGFSTAEKITDISGRGVGMDVVRNNIKNLKGNVNVESVVGQGTTFTLSLPLTLAIIDALMVTVGGETFAIPLDAVSETTKIEAKKLTEIAGSKAITLRGEVLGVSVLREMLDETGQLFGPAPESDILPMVVMHENDRRLGLIVDRLLERQEIVIKPLGEYLNSFDLRGVSGATIMGDGSVVLILDPHEVYNIATHAVRTAV